MIVLPRNILKFLFLHSLNSNSVPTELHRHKIKYESVLRFLTTEIDLILGQKFKQKLMRAFKEKSYKNAIF